jgi:hypothetical protein
MHPPPGLVLGVDLIGPPLEEMLHQLVGRLENGHPEKNLQLLHIHGGRLELRDQLLDLGVLGEEELRWEVFFFERAAISARVLSTI